MVYFRQLTFYMKDILRWVVYGAVFAVPFCLLIVSSSMFFPYITGKNFAFRILVEIALAGYVLLALYDSSYRPRWSWVLPAIGGMVVVMFFANILGEYSHKSFWSNYERMEGWITLVHFFFYFIVLAGVLKTEKLWGWFFNTALVAAVIMSLYALGQASGAIEISQGGNWRVDGRLGNSSYLGVYMLFHMFIAAWMFLRVRSNNYKLIYGALFLLFAYLMVHTGTRGSVLGLIGGSTLSFGYLALMAERGATIKKWALGGLVAVVVVAGGLWAARDTSFVKESAMLNRVAGVTLAEGGIRFMVWQMALEGIQERPLLGWGQENFNYVFNEFYNPALYGAEPWYDRTHNIFLDWLIAGGVLGLVGYLSILCAALWYATLRPAWNRWKSGKADQKTFTVEEQALILGLLAAYMVHNLFVFDNLASWIFYAVVLALIHSRVGREIKTLTDYRVDRSVITNAIMPAVVVIAVGVIYFVNVPGILASRDIIKAYQQTSSEEQMEILKSAISHGSFARQEIVEQLAQLGGRAILFGEVDEDQRAEIIEVVETSLVNLIAEKPKDARVYVIFGSFYRMIGELDNAMEQFVLAEELSPRKQAIIEEQGLIYLAAGRYEEAIAAYERSYALERRNYSALVHLAAAYLLSGDEERFNELVSEEELAKKGGLWYAYVNDEISLQVANQLKRYDLLELILLSRIELDPSNSEHRYNLAAVYYEQGNKEQAISVLEQAIKDIPAFKSRGETMIRQLRAQNE